MLLIRRLPVLIAIASAFSVSAAATLPPAATEAVTVQVPEGMQAPPFDVPRKLKVPPGFSIAVYARVDGARFMAIAPNGDLLVSDPGGGHITLLQRNSSGTVRQSTFASGLHHPHDMVFHKIDGATYLYVAESDRIVRTPYTDGQTTIGKSQTVVDKLPDSSHGLKAGYSHPLKNIALHRDKLYVSIGSSCNVCASDTRADPVRAAIYQYDADGSHRRLYAQGLRNAEGLVFEPGTDRLWAVVNSRDNIAYPRHDDWNGDGSDDFGKVMQSYVDGQPPDLLLQVRDGANYGWPFCNPDPEHGLADMSYSRDVQTNPDGSKLDCANVARAMRGIPAHAAPLGLSFLQDSGMPPPYRDALVTALHGCWNCSKLNGHKVVLFSLQPNGMPGAAVDLVSGWITDAAARQRWGRPVDAVPDGKGGLYISDDYSNTVYLLKKRM